MKNAKNYCVTDKRKIKTSIEIKFLADDYDPKFIELMPRIARELEDLIKKLGIDDSIPYQIIIK